MTVKEILELNQQTGDTVIVQYENSLGGTVLKIEDHFKD